MDLKRKNLKVQNRPDPCQCILGIPLNCRYSLFCTRRHNHKCYEMTRLGRGRQCGVNVIVSEETTQHIAETRNH